VRHTSAGSSHGSLRTGGGEDPRSVNGNGSPGNGRSPRGGEPGAMPTVRESGDLERSRENWGRVPA
jgi:hypothetical protein